MTNLEKVLMLQQMVDADDSEVVILELYVDLAGQKILNRMYPYKDDYTGLEVPDRYVAAQLKISSYMYLKRGSEGQIQHIENGIHRNYGDADIPESMLKDITPFCQAIR